MIRLLHVKRDGSIFDISGLVEQVKWGGRKGSAARTLEVSLLDSSRCGLGRTNIDIEDGQSCVFYWNDTELFRGLIMSQQQSDKQKMPIKAFTFRTVKTRLPIKTKPPRKYSLIAATDFKCPIMKLLTLHTE